MYSRASRSPAVTKSSTLYYPLWLAYATGVLEKAGHEVRLIDAPAFDYSKEEVCRIIESFEPRLVVVDTTTGSIQNDLEVAAAIKARSGAFIVLVGTHATALPEEVLEQCPAADAVARGEYDYILKSLAEVLGRDGGLAEVYGLTYRQGGEIKTNPVMDKIEDLDEIPFVAEVYKRHLDPVIHRYFYGANRHPVMTIVSGRGCPYKCCYCVYPQVMQGHKYRLRSVEKVVAEMVYIRETFPHVKEIFIEDDTLTVNKARVVALCKEIIKRKLKVTWSANSRAQADLETLKIMKKAGCRLLCVGYESGDQKVLDALGKKLRIEEIHEFTRHAKKAGILIHGCFLVGNPGETKDSLRMTLDMAKKLNPDTAQFYPIMVYPGTRAYHWAKSNGFLLTEDFSQWLTPEGLHHSVVSTPEVSREELVAWADNARREFYLRPAFVVAKIYQALRFPEEISRLSRGFLSLIKFIFRHEKVNECPSCK